MGTSWPDKVQPRRRGPAGQVTILARLGPETAAG